MSKAINYGILCEDRAHRNFLAHYLNQCHPSLFQENEQFGWQIKATNDREVEDALPDATRQGFTKFRLDALFVGRDADSTDDKKIKDLKSKLSALCNEHPKVIFMVPIQCIEHWLLHLKWHRDNPTLTKNEPQEHIMCPDAKLKVYGGKLKVEKQLEKANEILIDFDATWLESRSESFKHFHNQVKAFLARSQ